MLRKHIGHQLGAGEQHACCFCIHGADIPVGKHNYLNHHMFKLELQTQKKSDMKQKVKWAVKTLNKDQKRSFSWYYFGNEKKCLLVISSFLKHHLLGDHDNMSS